jgi:hypothetical protein
MIKIKNSLKSLKNFLKSLNINNILLSLISLYLGILILSNLFFITQTENYFDAGKYTLSALLGLLVGFLIKLSNDK